MIRWIKKMFLSDEAQQRARIAEDMLFGKGSIQIDKEIAEATAKLATAFCSNNSPGVVDAGSFIFIKLKGSDGEFRISARRLTLQDRIKLNENRGLVIDPHKLAEEFQLRPISIENHQK